MIAWEIRARIPRMPGDVLPLRRERGMPWLGRERGRPNWYIYYCDKGRVLRRSTGTAIRLEAESRLTEFIHEFNGGRVPKSELPTWGAVASSVVERQRRSAKARGIEFDLTPAYVLALIQKAKFRCPVSGIAFSEERGEFHKNPWAPSIDRIDNRHGYVAGNVRVVSLAANLAMNEWGYDVLLRLAHGVVNSSFATAEESRG
jgi:hypothetical protein